jgi:hypothetical protein
MSMRESHSAFPWISAESTSRTFPACARYVSAFARVSDPRREVPDDQHGHMAGILELPELPQDDGMPQGEVRTTGIDTQLDPKRATPLEPLLQTARRNEIDAAARERRQHVGGHGAAMLPAHLPDPEYDQGYTRPR